MHTVPPFPGARSEPEAHELAEELSSRLIEWLESSGGARALLHISEGRQKLEEVLERRWTDVRDELAWRTDSLLDLVRELEAREDPAFEGDDDPTIEDALRLRVRLQGYCLAQRLEEWRRQWLRARGRALTYRIEAGTNGPDLVHLWITATGRKVELPGRREVHEMLRVMCENPEVSRTLKEFEHLHEIGNASRARKGINAALQAAQPVSGDWLKLNPVAWAEGVYLTEGDLKAGVGEPVDRD